MTSKEKDSPRDRMDLGELWLLMRRNRLMIVAAAGGVLAAVIVGTLASRMEFRARGSLYLGELQTAAPTGTGAPDRWDFAGSGSGDVGTEIEILKSQELVHSAVFESGLNVMVAPVDWKEPRYLSWRLAHRDLRLLDVGARRLIVTRAALNPGSGGRRELTVRFVGDTGYEIWSKDQRLGSGTLGKEFQGGDLKATLLAGPDGAPAPGELYSMVVSSVDEVADDAAKRVNVTIPKITASGEAVKVVGIDFTDRSPLGAARFVEMLMQAYLDRRQSWKTEEATRAESFVSTQVAGMKEALDDAERKLADYKKSSNVVSLSDEAKGMVDQIGKYEEQRVAARLQVAQFGQIQDLLKQPNAPIEQYLVGEGEDPVLAGLSGNLAQAQQELRRIEDRFTPDAPAAREQKSQVDGQLRVVKNYVIGRYNRAQKQLDSVNEMIGQFEKKLKTVPGAELDLARLARHTEVLSKMYSFLLERQQQAGVTKASTISRNRILDGADTPRREDSPAAGIRLLVGTLLGLLLGTLFVVLRRMLAPTFQTEGELRRVLGDRPVLATVPDTDQARTDRRPKSAIAAGFAAPASAFSSDPGSMFAESFRHLRTNLYYNDRERSERVVLITSPTPGDGKTLCTFSLAAALASDERRVLVIEGDMRRSAVLEGQATRTGALKPQSLGLSSVLRRRSHWTDVVRAIPTSCGTFDLIAAGATPPSPAELLSGAHFQALLADVRQNYELVIIDSPPFPLVADALIMAMHVDRVISVVRPGNTNRRAAEEHLQRFATVAPHHGFVINGVDALAAGWARDYAQAYQSGQELVPETGRLSAPA
jgi:tyrosine-protein kinase Etk/Wzc